MSAGATTSKRARTDDTDASNAAEGSCTMSEGSKHRRVPTPVQSSLELATGTKPGLGVHKCSEKGCNISVGLHLYCIIGFTCMHQQLALQLSVCSQFASLAVSQGASRFHPPFAYKSAQQSCCCKAQCAQVFTRPAVISVWSACKLKTPTTI